MARPRALPSLRTLSRLRWFFKINVSYINQISVTGMSKKGKNIG